MVRAVHFSKYGTLDLAIELVFATQPTGNVTFAARSCGYHVVWVSYFLL